ncbi:FG-GAP-like repeat-containing protein [Bacteroides sp.]
MKIRILLTAVCCLCLSVHSIYAENVTVGKWRIDINENNAKASIYHDNTLLISENSCAFKNGDTEYHQDQLSGYAIRTTDITDSFGTGKQITITAKTADGITVTQDYFLYNDYVLTEVRIESQQELASNYMAPIKTSSEVNFLPDNIYNRVLFVPFDNDAFVRFGSYNFSKGEASPSTSYEVGALYNDDTRQGLVLGSVEHSDWKTGVVAHTSNGNNIAAIEVYGGITSEYTRDTYYKNDGDQLTDKGFNNNKSNAPTPHGKLRGKMVKSPKVFIGYFSDWRTGMETFGDVNAIVAPKAVWDGSKPFGWNSWGVLQGNVNYQNASETAAFIKNELKVFSDGANDVYIGLDAGGGKLDDEGKMEAFIAECKARGQKVGGYMNTFVSWGDDPYDVCLKANGQYIRFDGAYALDPTHPSVLNGIKNAIESHIAKGFSFVKIDFMSHGAVEADSYYDKTVHTGMQAYNKGMQEIYKYAAGRIYVNLSIAPIFPAQYAQSRRISCDAWSSIGNTKYVLNCLSYGWWLDHVYHYNDADHVVLNGATEAENRSRITSSILTGIFILGDNLSNDGSSESNTGKTRATKFLNNPEIIRIARQCKAFRPVDSAPSAGNEDAARDFYATVEDTMYVAAYNYNTLLSANHEMNCGRMGLQKGTEYIVRELWSNTESVKTDTWSEKISARDVKLFKIYPKNPTPQTLKEAVWKKGEGFPDWMADGRYIWGDFNNDGYKDAFYIAGQGGGNIGLYMNNSGNGFTKQEITIPALNWASAAFIDYDNDGNLDLIVSGRTNEVNGDRQVVTRVYRNNGAPDYTFSEATERSAELIGITSGNINDSNRPGRYLQTIDYNHDGWMDLIMTGVTSDGSSVTVLFRNNQGVFERQNNVADGNEFRGVSGGSIHIGDVNNDGYPDIFVQGWNGDYYADLYMNNKNGTFTRSEELSRLFTASQGAETVFTDINGDGYDDIVEINENAANLFINNKDNTFTKYDDPTNGLHKSGAVSITAGDVNNDGRTDLLVSGYNIITKIYYNNGDNTFTGVDVPAEAVARSGNVNLVDINGDRTLDFSNFGYGNNWVNTYMLNDLSRNAIPANLAPRTPAGLTAEYTEGKFTLSWEASADAITPQNAIRYNVYAKDENNGIVYFHSPADLATGKLKTGGAITSLINQTSFEWNLPDGKYTFGVQAIDQADAASEFLTIKYPILKVEEAVWTVGGKFDHYLESGDAIWGDYNNDGRVDMLIVGGRDGGTLALYEQNQKGKFERVQTDNKALGVLSYAKATFIDYDNDNDLDIVLMGRGSNGVNATIVLENTGAENQYTYVKNDALAAGFLRHAFTNNSHSGRGLIAFDYDNDGYTDILASGDVAFNSVTRTYATALYKNMEGKEFVRQTTAVNGGEFRHISQGSVHVGDVNGDGYLDIYNQGYALLPTPEEIGYLYINNQDGTFTQVAMDGFVPKKFSDAALVDVNGDGYSDIVEVNETSATLYLNDKNGKFIETTGTGLINGSCVQSTAGDINNDGYMDLIVTGEGIVTRVFYNYGDNTFALGGLPSEVVERCGAINLVDINGDGTLDVASFGWQGDWKNAYVFNDLSESKIQKNAAPEIPTNLKVESVDGKVVLSWDKATDDHTPQDALRYNVYVKNNTDNTVYTFAPVDVETGVLKVRNLVPLIQTNRFELNGLANGKYTFGVQAVDQADLGGKFAIVNQDIASSIHSSAFEKVNVYTTDNRQIMIKNDMQASVDYTILSTNGMTVNAGVCNAAAQYLSPALEQGVYIVRLSKGEDESYSVKITIR